MCIKPSMHLKIFKIFFFLIILIKPGFSDVINKVEIKGNKRLSDASILVFTNIEFGKNYEDQDLNVIFKDLYKTNFFKDIKLNVNNQTLIINVVENYIIENITFEGFKNKKLLEAISEFTKLKSRSSYNEYILKEDINNIKNFLKEVGYYSSKIKTSLDTNVETNTANLIYKIDLGNKAKIDEIVFIGNKIFKDRKLASIIASEEAKFWKFISNKIYVDQNRINLDQRLLVNYYKNKGYYNVTVLKAFAEFTNNDSFKLIYNINAGNKYYFNDIKLILPDDYEKNDFLKVEKLANKFKNKYYSLNKVEELLDEIDNIALFKKYEFIDAVITENVSDENKLNFDITIKDSKKFYVEKINIIGNSITIEEVIRNSLIVDEGDPFNEILFSKSINKIKAKNIFKTVTTKSLKGSSDQSKIIEIAVEEKATGEISLGAGASTSGATIGGGISENNFLGKGIKLKTNINFSDSTVKGGFVYEKPNFNYTDNTLFTSVSTTSTDNLADYGYETNNTSFSLGTGFEQYQNLFFTPSIATSYENLQTTSAASSNLKKQEGKYFDTYFNYSLNYDMRDQAYQPTSGYQASFSQELPVLSNNYEFSNTIQYIKYKKFPLDIVGKVNFYGNHINALSDGKDVRISKRAFLSQNKLRGFESGKIGPVDNGDFIGGNYLGAISFSATLPKLIPSFQNSDISIFLDTANVWGVDYSSTINDSSKIRSSTGVLLDVLTPVGPMNFSWALPITKKQTDVTEFFRFNIGTTF
jgi:outer membrane protein insertion porin family